MSDNVTYNPNKITEDLLRIISEWDENATEGAFNIRQDSACVGRQSSEHIRIEPKDGGSGLEIYVDSECQGEKVYIPACISKGGVDDLVYNDFHIAEGADVTIVAGCGVHTADHETSKHNGIHRFFLAPHSHVLYQEKHVGVGEGDGKRIIDPVTDAFLEEGAVLEMETSQIGGVDHTDRITKGKLGKDAKLIIHESLMTEKDQYAKTQFEVDMDGEDSAVDLISRSVAKDDSYQEYSSSIRGNTRCTGHSECDAILVGNGKVNASPALLGADLDAELIHEAAIGKVAGEQILKLRSMGLTDEEAEQKIIDGFLRG